MQVNAKLPLLVRGTPIRHNGPRNIFVSHDFAWDIPEVSSSEVELVFENFKAFGPEVDQNDPLFRPLLFKEVDQYKCVIKHEGSLYRRISDDGDDIPQLFRYAFPNGYNSSLREEISKARDQYSGLLRYDSPVSLPVLNHLVWQLKCQERQARPELDTWPTSFRIQATEAVHGRGPLWKRDHVMFEDVLPKLTEFNHDQMQECLRTYQGHMANFLLVDGQLWMKTRPPVYKVERRFDSTQTVSLVVSLAFAPDYQDTDLANGYFSLDARDEAFEYAHLFRGIREKEYAEDGKEVAIKGNVFDLTAKYVAHDPESMAYDYQAEELRRISSGLAVQTWRAEFKNPGRISRFGEALADDVNKAFAAVQATNYILGEYGDPSDWLDSIITAWKHARRPSGTYSFGETGLTDLLIERAKRFEENKPISVIGIASAPRI